MSKTEGNEDRIQFAMKRLLSSSIKRFSKDCDDENKRILNELTVQLAQEINAYKGRNKYIVNAILFEKGSNDIIMSAICLWNNQRDKHVKFEIEHQDFTCIVTVWIIAIE